MKTIFKITLYVLITIPIFHITVRIIHYGPFFTALWLLFCLVMGGFLKPLVDRLAKKLFG